MSDEFEESKDLGEATNWRRRPCVAGYLRSRVLPIPQNRISIAVVVWWNTNRQAVVKV
jgi:hypothetical protein